MAAEKSGEKVERESHGCGTAAEEETRRLVQLYSGPPEEPPVEAAPRAGIWDRGRPSSKGDFVKKRIQMEGDRF